jgi:hypothetical protein
MRGEYTELPCRFCDKGRIQAWYIPGIWTEKRTGRSSLGKGLSVKKSSDIWIIKSGCNVCNKSLEEVEKKLKENRII